MYYNFDDPNLRYHLVTCYYPAVEKLLNAVYNFQQAVKKNNFSLFKRLSDELERAHKEWKDELDHLNMINKLCGE